MITVYIPPSFIPERRYVVHTLLHHYLGIETEIIDRPGQLHYELVWENKSIVIKDEFFGHTFVGDSYLSQDRIPGGCHEAQSPELDKIIILYGHDHVVMSPGRVECDADLFAGAFFMLTRWEESVHTVEDVHGRFPAEQSLVVKSGQILRPIVDEYVALIRSWLIRLNYPVPARVDQFTVVPSCDVDLPYFWLRKPRWKVLTNEWRKNRTWSSLNRAKQMIKAVESGDQQDPYDTFDYIMEEAEKSGHRVQFNMLAGGLTKYEGTYSIRDARIQMLMERFQKRNHRVGLHPSYNSFVDVHAIREEKKSLEKQLNQPVHSSRQHYLKFSVPLTWRLLSEAGIKEDGSMGYAAEPGFRCGTSKPYPVFDIHQRKELPLIERPLLIMDVSLRYYKQLSVEESIQLCEVIYREVKKHNGRLEFLWHNSNLSEVEGWAPWKRVFEYFMQLS